MSYVDDTHLETHTLSTQKTLAYYEHLNKQYGPVCGFYIGQRPQIVVTDIDVLKGVLVKNFKNFQDRQVS